MASRRHTAILLAALIAVPASGPSAQDPAPPTVAPLPLPEELVLRGDNVIAVTLGGVPVRLEVSAEAFGLPVVNPDTAARALLVAESRRGWRFGPVVVEGVTASTPVDFGAGALPLAVSWTDRPVSDRADGVIGVHHMPYQRVTFALRDPAPGEMLHRFPLRSTGGDSNTRLGTEVTVGKKKLMMIFVPERSENLITAPTANFIATHQEGGFEPGSGGIAVMDFGVERPTRMMRIAEPILLGDLPLIRFAVRVEDYGDPKRVGEIAADDPRFDPNTILVSRRKGRGRPDLLTRIGRDQIAHCSSITYDLELREIRLSCAPLNSG
ncbi:hypothetical protein [Erythrobacter oryzae]|uniref:hypothetical protein n=1 Tax=Erythrobacter oryzae TaxID=3019556 RepID=UPI002557BB5F|nr:hypothetical protein [Erythrobacter sp. COR-2]